LNESKEKIYAKALWDELNQLSAGLCRCEKSAREPQLREELQKMTAAVSNKRQALKRLTEDLR
jgi:hypothetical protein